MQVFINNNARFCYKSDFEKSESDESDSDSKDETKPDDESNE